MPANTTATLLLPVVDEKDGITESGRPLEEAEGVILKGIENGKAVIELQSGTYEFQVEESLPTRVEEAARGTLRVSPNPFRDQLHIVCDEGVKGVSVTSGSGQMVYRQDHAGSIHTASWRPGLYVVKVDTPDHAYCTKVIKE